MTLTTQQLSELALEAGLTGFGVCSADPFLDVEQNLEAAVDSGRSAGMSFTYSDPRRSTDITVTYPWAHRLVVGARAYLPDAGSPALENGRSGRVARFSTEDHYAPLRSGLEVVAATLQAAGHRCAIVVDDNRLVDRAAAVRAGVGWWGKNTMVLAPGSGPWLLLGSIVTDAELEITAPMERTCGTCSACLPACPTGALVAPGVLDARLCIAYWLQSPEWIPTAIRPHIEDRFYGCDDCLEACPPGSRLLEDSPMRATTVDLVEVLRADEADLLDTFDRFYIPRRRANYLRRNALVALGNSSDRSAVTEVGRYLDDDDPMLRGHAAWALGQLGGERAIRWLTAAEEHETDDRVVGELRDALGSLPSC